MSLRKSAKRLTDFGKSCGVSAQQFIDHFRMAKIKQLPCGEPIQNKFKLDDKEIETIYKSVCKKVGCKKCQFYNGTIYYEKGQS